MQIQPMFLILLLCLPILDAFSHFYEPYLSPLAHALAGALMPFGIYCSMQFFSLLLVIESANPLSSFSIITLILKTICIL